MMKYRLIYSALLAILTLWLFTPAANAQCASPVGTAGQIIYNGDVQQLSYCDGTDWIGVSGSGNPPWQQIGNRLTDGTSSTSPDITTLDSTTIAFTNEVANILETYSWDGTDWSQVGNTFSVTTNEPEITTLDSTTIAMYNDLATNTIATYSWDGTDWSQVGNGLNIGATLSDGDMTALDSTTIVVIEAQQDDLTTYSWDGTDWTQVGNFLALPVSNGVAMTALDSTTIAIERGGTSNWSLETYSWDGSDWTQVGNTYSLPHNISSMTALDSTTIAAGISDEDLVTTYTWDGTDWTSTGHIHDITDGAISISLAALDSSTVAMYQRDIPRDFRTLFYNAASTQTDFSFGLVGHWKLDETSGTTATDSSGLGNTGTMNNGLDAGNDSIAGQINTALDFDGTNDDINAGSGASLDDIVVKTITAWIRIDSPVSAPYVEIMTKDAGCSGLTSWYFYVDTSMRLRHDHCPNGGTGDWSTTETLNVGQWYHVAMVYDRSSLTNDTIFYIDGVAATVTENSAPTGSNTSDGSADLLIGADGGGNNFDGAMDDIRIYNRALSAAEIGELYAGCEEGHLIYNEDHHVPQYCAGGDTWVAMGPVRDGIDSGLVGHWTLDETTGSSIADSSDNSNTGTWSDGADNNVTGETTSGKISTALDFDGTDDVINAGSDTSLDDIQLQTGAGMSISGWINPASGNNNSLIISKEEVSAGAGWGLFIPSPSGMGLGLSINRSTASMIAQTAGGTIAADEWQHVVATWNGGTTVATDIQLYINGQEVSANYTEAGSGAIASDASRSVYIGNNAFGTADFDGTIDDVRLYNRVLHITEIKALYDLGLNNDGSLVGHWKLDEQTGQTVSDSAGSLDGTFYNGASPADVSATAGVDGGAFTFDDTNTYVYVPDTDPLQGLNNLSVSMWVYPYSSEQKTWFTSDVNNNQRLVDIAHAANLNLSARVFDTTGSSSTVTPLKTLSAPNNEWSHLLVTYDGTTRLYRNGVLLITSSTTGLGATRSGPNDDMGIGGNPGASAVVDGRIDDVRIYNRTLSANEALALYEAGIGGCTNPVGKEGDLIFNDDTNINAVQYCDGVSWQAVGKALNDGSPIGCNTIGDVCSDGTVYAGLTPDGNVPFYVTRCDLGESWNGSSCTGSSSGPRWNDGSGSGAPGDVVTGATSTSDGDGNTATIAPLDSDSVASGFQDHEAALACDNLVLNGHSDWYLPAEDEVDDLYTNRIAIGNFDLTGGDPAGRYWSSTEIDNRNARQNNFFSGTTSTVAKFSNGAVRCARQ